MRTGQIVLLLGFLFFCFQVQAQEEIALTAEEINAYSEQSKQMVKYLEGTLNFLGDPNEVTSEKEVIINQSFAKMFQSEDVQIEDDLDENREIPLSKDVQAYLKDIDFFYKTVSFTFEVNSVEQFVNENNQIYFKVTTSRNLQGITIESDTVNNNQVRYLEVNLDPYKQDLKIASIYTTQPDAKRELRYWWNNMSVEWKDFFGKQVDLVYDTLPLSEIVSIEDSLFVIYRPTEQILTDSVIASEGDTLSFEGIDDSRPIVGDIVQLVDTVIVNVADTIQADLAIIYKRLKQISKIQTLDISNDSLIKDLSAVSQLTDLAAIALSNTAVNDLNPLRNLNKLQFINCSESAVLSLDALRYNSNLTELNCSHTNLADLSVASNFKNLNTFNLSHTLVKSILPLTELSAVSHLSLSGINLDDWKELRKMTGLTNLNLSTSGIQDINPLDSLLSLQNLNIDSTAVVELDALENLTSLSAIEANHTGVTDLSPLESLTALKIIYCDNSAVKEKEAIRFMQINPSCLVIYNTEKLHNWWAEMPSAYKNIIEQRKTLSDPVTTEQLHEIINLTKVDLSGQEEIKSLDPIAMLHRLEELDIEDTPIQDLSPLSGLTNLKVLNLDNTKVTSLSPLETHFNLQTIHCENTEISDLLVLKKNTGLETINCDESAVHQLNVLTLQQSLPECLVVFQSSLLQSWWIDLSNVWQSVFHEQLEMDEQPSKEQFQALVNLRTVNITDNSSINDLHALHLFVRMSELHVSKTSVRDISPITVLNKLKILSLPNNPINDLSTLDQLGNLEELNLENTSVDDLEMIGTLSQLKKLNIAGTNTKSLKDIQGLLNLESLLIYNTNVKSLKPIAKMEKLTELKCYNTSLKASRVNDFKSSHPGTVVTFY